MYFLKNIEMVMQITRGALRLPFSGAWLLFFKLRTVLLSLVLLLGLTFSTAAQTVDATNSSTISGALSITIAHTTGASVNRLMLVGIAVGNTTASSVTYGGTALTLVGTKTLADVNVQIYRLLNPTSGTANLVVNFSTSVSAIIGVTTFSGVDQTTPIGTFASNSASTNTPTITFASATGELAFCALCTKGTAVTPGTGVTELWDKASSPYNGAAGTAAGVASVTMAWTASVLDDWAIAGVSIKPAAITYPGGVSTNLSLWLKADVGTNITTDGTGVTTWINSVSGGQVSSAASGLQPLYRISSAHYNFNPLLAFDGVDDYFSTTSNYGVTGTSAFSSFAVTRRATDNTVDMIYGGSLNGANSLGFLIHSNDLGLLEAQTIGTKTGTTAAALAGIGTIKGFVRSGINTWQIYHNGAVDGIAGGITAFGGTLATSNLNIGVGEGTQAPFDGDIAEIIIHSGALSAPDVNKINSYLAIKYGITLDQTTPQNYVNSAGTVLWNGSNNSVYKNNITGIGRDDNSALNQKQSKSVNTATALVTVGNGNTIDVSNAANVNNFSTNNSFLIFGDNAGAMAWQITGAPIGRERLTREWRVQETGTVGSLKIQIPDNSSTLTTKLPAEGTAVYLLMDADGDFSSGATEIAMTLNGTNWEANVDLTDGQYFTIATSCTFSLTGTPVNVTTCFGASTGSINITASGGIAPYTYDWADIAGISNVEDRSALAAGTYTVSVTDANNCQAVSSFTITQPTALSLSTTVTNVVPAGASNGAITLIVSGGTSPYTYDWADVGGPNNTQNRTAIAGGTYTVTVTDNNGCTATTSALVVEISFVNKQLYLSDPSQALDRTDPVASADATTASTVNLSSTATGVVVVNSVTNSSANPGSTTFTVPNVTVGAGSNRLMLVGINQKNKLVNGVTYGGTSLTLVGEDIGNGNARMHMYMMLNPPSGTADVVVTLSANPDKGIVVGVTNFTGVNQSTPLGTFNSTNGKTLASSITVSSATGELVYDVATSRQATESANAGQTVLYNLDAGNEVNGGGASTQPGAASVTMGWSLSALHEWAIGAVSIKPAVAVTNTTFTQNPTLCSALTIKSGQTITVANYVTIISGTMPASPNITAVLKYGSTNIITLSSPTYNSSTGILTWTGTLGADMTIPAGQAIALQITTAQAGVAFRIDYDSQTKPSKVSLPVTTYIDIPTYAVYSAAYPGGSIITNAVGGTTVYPRVTVTDPFGFSDITGMNITITPPSTLVSATSVATSGCTRTYQYTWVTPVASGTYNIPATAKEGLENTVTDVQALSFDLCSPTVSTPVFALGATSTRCQGVSTVTYTATAANSTSISYSLDAASLAAGNTINTATSAVTYVAGWTTNTVITATALGCGGPSTANHTVTTTPSVSAPVFSSGATSTRCQGAGSVTYTASAANSTSITYSLDAASITGGNSIGAATGVVTYVAGWNGTSTITASAAGCNGPTTATHSVTTTPSVGTPVFGFGANFPRCVLAATYTATATNSTGITYSLDATSLAAGCTINSATGAVTYPNTWTGTTVITASAAGCNGPATATNSVAVSALCAPVAVNDLATGAGGAPLPINVLANDYDLNNNINTASLTVVTPPNNGLAIISSGQIVYLPNGSFSGNDSFTYRICDNSAFFPLCSTAKVYVTIDPFIFDPCSEATQRHVYYIPFPEQDARTALLASQNIGLVVNDVRTIISLKMPYPGMVVRWDHWEDGYETDINNPTQSTTKVWGDGNPFNGIAPGYPNDIIPSGGSIVFDNTIPSNPRVAANFFYDGRDKIVSSGQITVTQALGEPANINVQCMKTNVSASIDYGKSFTIPVGQNFPTQDFAYTALFIRASENNTTVNIDKDNNGSFETTAVLNEGQSLLVNGGVLNGAVVTSSAPVGVDVHFGGIDGFSSREVPIYPASWYSDTYYTPVPTTQSPDTAVVMLYNSLNRAITINWTSGAPASGSIVLPAKTVKRFPLALSATATYKFVNPTGESFTAIEIVDAYSQGYTTGSTTLNQGSTYDWAFNLISEDRLTTFSSIAWAPGSIDGTANGNPVWVSPAANTTIYVKYNGAVLAGGSISPCGLHYDASYTLNALNYKKLLDSDNDQSGLAVFTCDGTKIAVAYGEDPSLSSPANPNWDVGSTMQPFCGAKLLFANDDYAFTLTNESVTIPVLPNDVGFLATIDPASLNNLGLLQPTNGTVSINANGTILYTPNPGFQGTDIFEYRICSTPAIVCDVATVYVKVNSCPTPNDQNLISGQVFLDKNKDALNNEGSTGVFGQKVFLYFDGNCNGTIDANELRDSVTVDSSGNYQFIKYPRKIIADNFDGAGGASTCATGSDGTLPWLTNWVDTGDPSVGFCITPAPANTDVEMVQDGAFGNALRLDNLNRAATRQANINGATYAFLSFSYRKAAATLVSTEDVYVQISTNGSAFTTIFTISGNGTTDAAYVNIYNLDILPYAASSTYIRFLTNGNVDEGDYVFIDDVSITFLKYPQCYITKIDPLSIPTNYYITTVGQHAMTANNGGTCLAPYDFGVVKNSVTVSGTLFNDANGLTDGLVNGTPIGTPSGAIVYAYLVDASGKVAFKTTLNAATGAYSFPLADVATNYTIQLSTLDSAVYTNAPTAANLPTGWTSTGENYGINNGAGTGNEAGTPNLAIAVNTALVSITGVNFGIQQVNAGLDKATCQFGSVTMAATTSPGTWVAQAGNPGTATITTPTSATTSITNFSAAGTYTFLWTNNSVTDIAQVVVTAKPNAGSDQTLCFKGSATLTGTSPTTGTWAAQTGNPVGASLSSTVGGIATANFVAAPAGTYNFIYTAAGCADTTSIVVTSAVAVSGTQVNVDCFSNATGSINITSSGGTAPYTYDWADMAGTNNVEDRTALVAGSYAVTVTDANLCTATTNFSIAQPVEITISTQPSNIIECITGTANLAVTATGGSGTLTYQWQNSSSSTGTFSNILGAVSSTYTPASVDTGTFYYRVLITDSSNSCDPTISNTATLTIVPKPTATVTLDVSTVCVGGTTPLRVTTLGGIGTCSILWQSSSNGGAWSDIAGANSTTYTPPALAASTKFRVIYTCSASGCCN